MTPTKVRTIVYLAGPIGNPRVIGELAVQQNVDRAVNVAMQLNLHGYSVICPHTSHYYPGAHDQPHAFWMEVDYALVLAADVVCRMPGESPGADNEVTWSRPVFSPEQLLEMPPDLLRRWKQPLFIYHSPGPLDEEENSL